MTSRGDILIEIQNAKKCTDEALRLWVRKNTNCKASDGTMTNYLQIARNWEALQVAYGTEEKLLETTVTELVSLLKKKGGETRTPLTHEQRQRIKQEKEAEKKQEAADKELARRNAAKVKAMEDGTQVKFVETIQSKHDANNGMVGWNVKFEDGTTLEMTVKEGMAVHSGGAVYFDKEPRVCDMVCSPIWSAITEVS